MSPVAGAGVGEGAAPQLRLSETAGLGLVHAPSGADAPSTRRHATSMVRVCVPEAQALHSPMPVCTQE